LLAVDLALTSFFTFSSTTLGWVSVIALASVLIFFSVDIAQTGGSKLSPKKATAKSTEKKIKTEAKATTETQRKVVHGKRLQRR
jgi:hypothetical protein